MKRDHLLFTDWEVTDEGKEFGIYGIDKIKEIIKENLVALSIFGKNETSELEAAVLPLKKS